MSAGDLCALLLLPLPFVVVWLTFGRDLREAEKFEREASDRLLGNSRETS